nr:mucin-2 [Crassostrea gigas]
MNFGLVILLATFTVSHAFFFDSLFGTSAPKPTVKTTKGATSAQGTKAVVLDYFAHKLCPKHLQRNRYLMYYSYVKRCYTFVITDRADWFTAKADCASNGGNLMNIHQSLENFYLGMRDQIALGHADAYIWIGLSDTVTPGNFSWINGPLKTYKHWHTGQPKMGTPGDNCVAYSHDTQDWSTFPCNSTKLGWVCEFELNATIPETTSNSVPSTTQSISTEPTTESSTPEPTTLEPTTPEPTTPEPKTPEPTTPEPTTPEPTTPEPTTPEPTTPEPTTQEPTTPKPTTPEPTPEPTEPEPTPETTTKHHMASKHTPKHTTTEKTTEAKTTTLPTTTTTEEETGIIIIGKRS